MRPSLKRLLNGVIDYAGLFPPAAFQMEKAVAEYVEVMDSDDQWIVDKFVCQATRLEEFVEALRPLVKAPVRTTVIGTIHKDGPVAGIKHDVDAVLKAEESGLVDVEGYELKVSETDVKSYASAASKMGSQLHDDLQVYLEFAWNEAMIDNMHDSVDVFEPVGFKARTGGTAAQDFPDAVQLAAFISECAALEAPFKYTAGLHEPLRYFDEKLGVFRHGFLNTILAGALAMTQDLSRKEIEEILMLVDPAQLNFGVDDIKVGNHWLESEQLPLFQSSFGGFGSCSVSEPLEGLRKLRLLEGGAA